MTADSDDVVCVVFVHGAFTDGTCWSRVISCLAQKGIETASAQLPLTSLADDVAAVLWSFDRCDGRVLLIGHGWGGAVITEAGNDPQVAGLLYIAGLAPDNGQSIVDWWKISAAAQIPACVECATPDGLLRLTVKGAREILSPDVPMEKADQVLALPRFIGSRCFSERVGKAAWRSKPTWFIVAQNDLVVPPEAARASALKMDATILTLASGHIPMISQPEAVASFILEALSILNNS